MFTVKEYIHMIKDENQQSCLKMWEYFQTSCSKAKGSSHNHQNWEGGYFDHIQEIMDFAYKLYFSISQDRELPFTLSDAMLILFLHDIEKPIKYGTNINFSNASNSQIRKMLMDEYGIKLNDYQLNGLNYIHGEGSEYRSDHRVMNELAAFCHCCDIISARIYYDYPKK